MTLTVVATVVVLLAIAGIAGSVARKVGVPYPVLLVVVGVLLALIPPLPSLHIEPDLILFVFLPPLVYRGAFHAPVRELIAGRRAILIFAVPGVLITALLVALPVHYLAGLSWTASLVLGTIVAPTDPVAALAVFRTLGVPPRLAAIVEGESLLNDGTGLVLYRILIAAAVGGAFSAGGAVLDFVRVAGGGIVIGVVIGFLSYTVLRVVDDAQAEATLHIAIAYGSYVVAEALHVSGILATVTVGVVLGSRFVRYSRVSTRIVGVASWDVLEFVANSLLFLLIGLQLRAILATLGGAVPLGKIASITAIVVVAVVVARFVMIFGANFLVRLANRVHVLSAPPLSAAWATVLAWSGLRGGVTLALALALPLTTNTGVPFPEHDLLQFLTFVVVVVTLVPCSLALPGILQRLGLTGDQEAATEELTARRYAALMARDAVGQITDAQLGPKGRQRIVDYYTAQVQYFDALLTGDGAGETHFPRWQAAQLQLLAVEHQAVETLAHERRISTMVAERVQRGLDLEAERLMAEGVADP